MQKKIKYKADTKNFIIPFIVFSLSFAIISYITINSVNSFYYSHMKEIWLNLAKSYSHSISKAAEATDILNKLLEEKLLVASSTISLYDKHQYSNEFIRELADKLEVDEINAYNPQGEIIYSNLSEFIGWKAYEGHPVYKFMKSKRTSYVEDIRPSADTGILYKYGYFKGSDGSFVQIGVQAAKIHNLLGRFEMKRLLQELQDVGIVKQSYFIDNTLSIAESTDSLLIRQEISSKEVKTAIRDNSEYGYITEDDGEKKYEVFVPVYFGKSKIGTLAIVQSLRDTEVVVRKLSLISLVTLVIIYALLFNTMISAYKKNRRLFQLLYFDPLTCLPNEQYLKELLTEEIDKKGENEKALLLININNFSIVNLTYGYEYGDELLKKAGIRIQELEDQNKKLLRFSAEGHVLYVKNYGGRIGLVSIANQICNIFENPLKGKSAEHNLEVKIGIVEINNKYDKIDQVLKDALISVNHIKKNDSINYTFYDEEMESKLKREGLIEKELRAVISGNETKNLYLEFQPQVDLKTNKIICFEALARMKTESLGFVSPLEFIDVAERKQLIIPLGNLIFKLACHFIRTLKVEGYGEIKVAVNISGIQLLQDEFIDKVMEVIKETDVEESNLELEITESVLLSNYEVINERLKKLRDRKIGIALDDFGTGYSSFSRLRELSIDTVKIDQYFVSKITSEEDNMQITGDIISMAHKLGLTVVTEGVEIQVQRDYLIKNDCDIMQGYLFSKPLSEKDSIELLKTNNPIIVNGRTVLL